MSSIGYDLTSDLDSFSNPRVRSDIETVKNILLTILLGRPGQYPSLPHIGLDIQSLLYSYYDELDTSNLQMSIIEQCEALSTYFSSGAIMIKKTLYHNRPSLIIQLTGTDSVNIDTECDKFLIGITFDDMNNMIYNVSNVGGS